MPRKTAFAAFGLSCLFSLTCVSAAQAAANPAGLAYRLTTNVSLYGKPTGMLVTGRCNRYDAAFANARARGAEVLAYLAPTQTPDHTVCALDTKFYMGDLGRVPLWPYPSYGQRVSWPNTHMTDMRPGSAWILAVVSYIEGLMRENKVDGVFLDTVNVRPWNKLAEYGSWPQWEKDRWAAGNVDLVKRLYASRNRLRPNFIIMNNGVWDSKYTTYGLAGERYVDGVCLEQPAYLSPWHVKYAAKPFGDGRHRRVLVIANTKTEAQGWAKVKGVSHVSAQADSGLAYPPPPPVGFTVLTDRR
jgi:hypothetical protein